MDYVDISDALITASSESDVHHTAKEVRWKRNSSDCFPAWVAASDDRAPWVQFDMEQDVTVWGVAVKPRCDDLYTNQRVTSFKVAASKDRRKWSYVSRVTSANFSVDNLFISWFDEAATAQNWRIEVLSWQHQPAMKADLIGQPKGSHVATIGYGIHNMRRIRRH